MERTLKEIFERKCKGQVMTDGLITTEEPGHTAETAQLQRHHDGRVSAAYYAVGTALGILDEAVGASILRELRKLQVTDPAHPHFGGFRWYREETKIADSNAAFFIIMPFVVLYLRRPGRIPDSHRAMMNEMMVDSVPWFAEACQSPSLYYPNKIVSDGAILLALSSLCGLDDTYGEAARFFERWEDYTERRGWGWGENCSITYLRVILTALQTACLVVREAQLRDRLERRIEQLLDYIRFHGRHEFVPTIRSYNYQGETDVANLIWLLSGVAHTASGDKGAGPIRNMPDIVTFLLFEERAAVHQEASGSGEPAADKRKADVPRIREERVFDDCRAYTWIGRSGRLGSLTRFPAMPGSYQQPGWGIGWQSFPVSFAVNGKQVSYLRWFVRDGSGGVRTHPAQSKKAYLNTALFAESVFPDIQTRSAQAGPVLLTVRSLSGVSHYAEEIADEWIVHRFTDGIDKIRTGSGEAMREWVVLRYPEASVAISTLRGMPVDQSQRVDMAISVIREADSVRLRQTLFAGEGTIVRHARLEAGWVVLFIDETMNEEQVRTHLGEFIIEDDTVFDPEVPRAGYEQLRLASVSFEGKPIVTLLTDPFGQVQTQVRELRSIKEGGKQDVDTGI